MPDRSSGSNPATASAELHVIADTVERQRDRVAAIAEPFLGTEREDIVDHGARGRAAVVDRHAGAATSDQNARALTRIDRRGRTKPAENGDDPPANRRVVQPVSRPGGGSQRIAANQVAGTWI